MDNGKIAGTKDFDNELGTWQVVDMSNIEMVINDTTYQVTLNHSGLVEEGMVATGS